jgi:NAD(P)-dependent dehydrogenase (short-subunit alcohol dehydrogenase family)
VSDTSVAGGVPPLPGPCCAAECGMDALAVRYAEEPAPLGIATSIVVPGAFATATGARSSSDRAATLGMVRRSDGCPRP